MIVDVNITTPLVSNFYPVKDVAGTLTQCTHADSEGVAVLRYNPVTAGTYQGEVYTDYVTRYQSFSVELNTSMETVNIYAKKLAGDTYFKVGHEIPVISGAVHFYLLDSDFSIGDPIWVKVEKIDDVEVFDEIEGVIG